MLNFIKQTHQFILKLIKMDFIYLFHLIYYQHCLPNEKTYKNIW